MIVGAVAGGAVAAWLLMIGRARRDRRTVIERLVNAPDDGADGAAAEVPGRHRRPPRRRSPAARAGAGLAEACDAIARDLRSGRSLTVAVLAVAEQAHQPYLAEIAAAVRAGQPLSVAIDAAAAGHSDADVALVSQVLAVAAEHGGSPAEAVDRAAATLRERSALHAERVAQAASARLSTRVMTVLPVGFTAVVATTDPAVREVLFATPIGWTCLALGLALNLAGRAWAKRALAA